MKKLLSILLVVVLLVGAGGYALATVADASVPGDTLYSVDLLAEDIQRAVTTDDLALAELETEILAERGDEIETLLDENTDEAVLGEAVDNLAKQQTRTEERVLKLFNEENNYDDASKEELRYRYENTIKNQVQSMDKVENQYKGLAENAKKGMEESLDMVTSLDSTGGAGNKEKNDDTGDSGDGIKDRESNSDEDTGNQSGQASQTGR